MGCAISHQSPGRGARSARVASCEPSSLRELWIRESRSIRRVERVALGVIAILGMGSAVWGLSLIQKLAAEWPAIEAALESLIR